MSPLIIQGDRIRPSIDFNPAKGRLSITGRCIPENALEVFDPMLDWLDGFCSSSPKAAVLDIRLEYFNSTSVNRLSTVVRKVADLRAKGTQVTINWHYEEDDEDMMDTGNDIITAFHVPMHLVPYSDG